MNASRPVFATTMMIAAAAMPAPDTIRHETTRVLLSRIVEADAAAMELNALLAAGAVSHGRYERAAQERDAAIEAAAEFLEKSRLLTAERR